LTNNLQNLFDGNWGFGQNGQERKWDFKLNIVVDAIGQYIQNRGGEGLLRGAGEEARRQKNSSRHYMHEECAFLG